MDVPFCHPSFFKNHHKSWLLTDIFCPDTPGASNGRPRPSIGHPRGVLGSQHLAVGRPKINRERLGERKKRSLERMGVTDYFEAHDLDHLGPFFGRPSDFTGPVIGVQSSAHGEILPFAAEGVVFFPCWF